MYRNYWEGITQEKHAEKSPELTHSQEQPVFPEQEELLTHGGLIESSEESYLSHGTRLHPN